MSSGLSLGDFPGEDGEAGSSVMLPNLFSKRGEFGSLRLPFGDCPGVEAPLDKQGEAGSIVSFDRLVGAPLLIKSIYSTLSNYSNPSFS